MGKVGLVIESKIFPSEFGNDLKYERKVCIKFRYRKPQEGKFILEGIGGVSLVGEGGR